jgi:N4-(beta-N-acetylglucosaminyl)-L-asparaginase
MKRRNFIKKASATGLGLVAVSSTIIGCDKETAKKEAFVATSKSIQCRWRQCFN